MKSYKSVEEAIRPADRKTAPGVLREHAGGIEPARRPRGSCLSPGPSRFRPRRAGRWCGRVRLDSRRPPRKPVASRGLRP